MDQLKARPANSSPLSPLGFLERTAIVYGDSPSLIYDSTTYTWAQTYRRCLRVASSIASLGIQTGQVVSVLAPNIPAMYELHFAVTMAGSVLNTINTRLDARSVSVILRHGESKLVFVDYQLTSIVLEAISLLPSDSRPPLLILINDDEPQAFPSSIPVGFYDTYEGMLRTGDPNFKWIRPESEWDPLTLNYTSGTTASPKGVVHSHRGTFIVTMDSLIEWSVPKKPVFLWTLPMFHVNGWSKVWGMAAVGAANICLRKFDSAVIYSAINRHSVTHMCAAPVVLTMLANSAPPNGLRNTVYILTGGSPPPPPVLLRVESMGFEVTHSFGMTETGGVVVSCAWKTEWNRLPATERARLKARQGVRSLGMTEVDVVYPETGDSVKRDGSTLGEIVLRGGCLMLGYFKDPAATSRCMRENGWFYTGDVGVMHPDGYMEIKDRSKDVIISGGENISSVEVETVLYSHPAVNEAAVVARPDDYWGETPCAFVSLKTEIEEKLTEKNVIEFCSGKLPRYMVPKTVVFKEELPKTTTGKIQKFVLREMARAMGCVGASRM